MPDPSAWRRPRPYALRARPPAAPTAIGTAEPDRPRPVSWSQSCGRRARGRGEEAAPRRHRLRPQHDGVLRQERASNVGDRRPGERPAGKGRAAAATAANRRAVRRAEALGEARPTRPPGPASGSARTCIAQSGGGAGRASRVAEEAHRIARADEDECFRPASRSTAASTGYGRRSTNTRPAPALDTGVRGLRQEPRPPVACAIREAPSSAPARSARSPSSSSAGSPLASTAAISAMCALRARARGAGSAARARDARALVPGRIGREDQRGDPPPAACSPPRSPARPPAPPAPASFTVFSQGDYCAASASMSAVSGALWGDGGKVACSPTTLIHRGARARRVVDVGEPVWRGPARGAAASPPASPPCGRSRRPRRWRRPRTGTARSGCPPRGPAPRRSASPTCRDWRSRPRTAALEQRARQAPRLRS